MSCAREASTFRLLDHVVGWDVATVDWLDDQPDGLRLALARPGVVERDAVDRFLLPPRLARGCGPCEWYLVTPPAPRSMLLRRGACDRGWRPASDDWCSPVELRHAVAVAARGDRLAVADRFDGGVRLWRQGGARLVATIAVDAPSALAFTASGALLVVAGDRLYRFDAAGIACADPTAVEPLAAGRRLDRFAVGDDHALWLVTVDAEGLQLWRRTAQEPFAPVSDAAALAEAFAPTTLSAVTERGFCVEETDDQGGGVTRCHSWYGRPVEARTLALPASPRFVTQGALLTVPIDSGIPRCRWHRIRVDADVPAGTGIDLAVSTTDVEPSPVGGSVGALAPAGPHPNDWWPLPRGVDDALIDQPAGRYLYLRLRLVGDGYETPVVRGIRLDFPRATSLDVLPAVYADEPESRDFGERFMALFDAALEDVDRAIDRFPALLDPGGVHADALPWLARFVALGTDQAWSVERRRTLIAAAPQLYRQRGTVAGLREAIRLVFDVVPALSEPAQGRRWGTLSDRREGLTSSARGRARLGEVRLFGRARARFRVGASALRTAPLRSYGDPEQDPFVADAYRVHVLVPPNTALDEAARERLVQLVASQVPAHVVPTVRFGASMLVVGRWSAVGIDTLVGSAPPSVLGKGLRLRRMSVVAPNRRGAHAAWRVGKTGAVGIDTIME